MSDLIWFIVIGVLLAFLGIVFIMLGWQIWKKQRMDLIISYHSDKVREENKQAYCTLSGSGILIMGIGFLLSGIIAVFVRSFQTFVPMMIGLVFGIALLVLAILKFNH
ncbi:MAG: DUF3784 domain-containing protein [Erysipelotrichaceae bacterium]|nr:DUF3784 domain-containing protein [Erysipelotrichaceae bacterium]